MAMRGDVRKFIRSLNGSVKIDCREDDVLELFIDPVQIVPIHVCQLFGCYSIMSVSSVLNDQNAACSRTGYTPFWEMSLLSARRRIIFTFFFFFFFFLPPTPYRESVKRLIDSSWPNHDISRYDRGNSGRLE